MSDVDKSGALLLNPRVAAAVVDVFVYVVVLNLFVEYGGRPDFRAFPERSARSRLVAGTPTAA